MARLGKRERTAKRETIRANLANPHIEHSSGTMDSTLNLDRVLSHTHMQSAHVGQNMRGTVNTKGASKRWGLS